MKFPPKEVCPRIKLSEDEKQQAESYVFNSALRGLHDKQLIGFKIFERLRYLKSKALKDCRRKIQLEFNATLLNEFNDLILIKRRGLRGELAFHKFRNSDIRIAFAVANTYIYHNLKLRNSEKILFPRVLPDACLDSSLFNNKCRKTIDIKTQGRKERNEFVGLSIYNESWKKWKARGTLANFYVAISEQKRKTYPYKILYYAILGYAFSWEIDDVIPHRGEKVNYTRGFRFIHFYNLHPIDLLTPSLYKNSVTVLDRINQLNI